ncbi:MAG: carotenoid oxygenase family protein [Gammaproteobacteria bacterium]|nr:carotenoid oxygenase family protein [Gammaproteobacteria bacterium]
MSSTEHEAEGKEAPAASTGTEDTRVDRRRFLGSVVTGSVAASAGLVGVSQRAEAGVMFPTERGKFGAGGSVAGAVHRAESDLYDCEVEGDLPADLDGCFYRVGPDPQYPKPEEWQNDIAFDGEGHVTYWRIKNGHVDYKSRYVKNQRWRAQHDARRSLFHMYRNPATDDPSVKGLSRSTANTQIWYFNNMLLAMKEDSPPVAMNPLTLDVIDDAYRFNGGMKGETFTAHPKIDSRTGEMIAFGYEASGLLSEDIEVFTADPKTGNVTWSAWIKAPYACMIHDFAATERHIAFLITPMTSSRQVIDARGPHFGWDSTLPSWLGVMRRGGDGKDIRWFRGPGEMATHTMGAWSDGDVFYWDVDGAESNQFPFFPHLHDKWDPAKAVGHVRRMKVDLSKRQDHYEVEIMYPEVSGVLARQDDRYHTEPYRWGYLIGGKGWVIFDHQKQTYKEFGLPDTSLAEMVFVPRNRNAAEGDGYLIGVATRRNEAGRSDVIIIDAQHPEDGVIATVHMPYRVPGQVHGFWVNGWQLPTA